MLRVVNHLAISQLEISVLGFAVFAVVIYVVNWKKPQGVQSPVTLRSYDHELPEAVMSIIEAEKKEGLLFDLIDVVAVLFDITPRAKPGRISNLGSGGGGDGILLMTLILSTTVFGAIHLVAWDFSFPTPFELFLWRGASSYLVLFSVLMFGSMWASVPAMNKADENGWHKTGIFIGNITFSLYVGLPILYVFCRLLIIVEMFRCLLFLPPDAYIATMASNIPHIS